MGILTYVRKGNPLVRIVDDLYGVSALVPLKRHSESEAASLAFLLPVDTDFVTIVVLSVMSGCGWQELLHDDFLEATGSRLMNGGTRIIQAIERGDNRGLHCSIYLIQC